MSHPYRKQAHTVNIPDHLLPQVGFDSVNLSGNSTPYPVDFDPMTLDGGDATAPTPIQNPTTYQRSNQNYPDQSVYSPNSNYSGHNQIGGHSGHHQPVHQNSPNHAGQPNHAGANHAGPNHAGANHTGHPYSPSAPLSPSKNRHPYSPIYSKPNSSQDLFGNGHRSPALMNGQSDINGQPYQNQNYSPGQFQPFNQLQPSAPMSPQYQYNQPYQPYQGQINGTGPNGYGPNGGRPNGNGPHGQVSSNGQVPESGAFTHPPAPRTHPGQPGPTVQPGQSPNQPPGKQRLYQSNASSEQIRTRRKPPGLPPIQTDRRIVSTAAVPTSAHERESPITPKESRTKSLSSVLKYQHYQNQGQQRMQPIQQGQAMNSKPSLQSNSNSNSSQNIHHTFSLSSRSRSFTSLSKLSSLSTKKFSSSTSLHGKDRNVSSLTIASNRTIVQVAKKPSVYPAMLSRVSRVFRESMLLTINTKDGLEYHDTFTGKMAVDIICRIIRTSDRNLALLLGRSLDSQKLFHDVTYQHRLRDSVHEVYAFNHVYTDVELYENNNDISGLPSTTSLPGFEAEQTSSPVTGVNGVFTILTDCYSPTCSRNRLCYSIACPRRLEQQARLNMKPGGDLKRAVSRLSLHEQDENKSLWHETVPQSVLDKLDKHEKMRQELIYEFIYTERDYVKDLEFMTDFYILPLRNPSNNIIPEREREAFIRTVFGGVSDLLRLAKSMSEALTRRQQTQKPVIQTFADVFLQFVDRFEPFIQYSGNKVFASFEHERQQQVNMRYASFLDAIEKRPESRRQDLSSFLIKGIQRPARYQLLLGGILKNTNPESPDYDNLVKAKLEIEKVLVKINIQTGESTDRHKVMVLHRLLGKQTLEEKYNFKLLYNNRIIYQVTLNRKRDNEKIDLYLFEHALLLVKHKIQNKREHYKVFERPIYLPLLFVNSGYDIPTFRTVINSRVNGSIISDSKAKVDSLNTKLQINFLGLGSHQVHCTLNADDVANQNQVLSQISSQQKKLVEKYDIFSLSKYETRRFTGNNKINCAVPCYGGKKLLYGTDSGVWVSTVRTISMTNNEKICSDPTMVISKLYVSQIEVLVEYSKILILSDKSLYEFDLSCTDSLDHVKNTRSGKLILTHVSLFKTGICDGKLLVCCIKQGSNHAINIFEPSNPFDKTKNKNRKYDIREITFNSDPISISFLRTRLCIGCTKGFEILSLEDGKKEPILDEADPSLDFATQKEIVNPLAIHRLGKDFLLLYSEFSFLINRNGWRTKHDWGIFWEGNPNNIALFYPYLLSFEQNFVEIRDLETSHLVRALTGENIRFLHSNEHEAMYACEENGYDVIVSIDFLNLKPK